MGDLRSSFSKAIDAFADALTEDVSSTRDVVRYKYSDFKSFTAKMHSEYPEAVVVRVAMTVETEFDGRVFPVPKFIIRILMLNKDGEPIRIGKEKDAYVGTVRVASEVDSKMNEFMKGKTVRTVCFPER